MKKALIASLATSALVIGAFAMSASAYVFSNNLSVGSTGNDVVALQSFLVSKGFLTMPAGVAEGYFGSLTKAAAVAYQASVGLPSTGFVGPMTRNVLNAGGSMTSTGSATCPTGYSCAPTTPVTFSCPSGWTCTPLAGTTGGTVTGASTATGITTPGVQGILSVTQGPVSNSVANAGQTKVPVLDIRLQAQYSDLSVQSVQLDLGTSTNLYNFVYSNLYLVDPTTGTVLSTIALNPSTVVQNGPDYIVSITGFNFIVPKGTYKDLVVEADLYNQINNQYATSNPWSIGVPGNGVRAVDGAGVNQYGPTGSATTGTNGNYIQPIEQTMIIGQSLITSATANIALDASSPQTGSVGVTNTTQGQYLGLPIMTFDVNAQGDNLHLHQVAVNIGVTGIGATVPAAYLFNGSTEVSSAAVVSGVATFTNITDGTAGASIPINSFTAFTVKVDVAGLTTGNGPAIINASTSGLVIYNSQDSNVNAPGSAIANTQTVFGAGPVFSLSGAPQIAKTNITAGGATTTTFQYTATFNVNVNAVGENVTFGLPGAVSTTLPAFGSATTASTSAEIYLNGSATTTAATIIGSYSQPSNTTINGNYFTLSQNQSVTVPVTYSFIVNNPGANTYAVQLNGVNYGIASNGSATNQISNFMANQTAWRTSAI